MYHISHEKSFIQQRTNNHLAFIRALNVLLLFAMALLDAQYGADFDFHPYCYMLVLSVILGLDIPKIIQALKDKKESAK